MQRALITFAALGMVFIFNHCQSKNSVPISIPNPSAGMIPHHQTEAQGDPSWKLKLNSNCADGNPEKCVAAYGFTVLADGRFQIGPAPQGQLHEGSLAPEELKSISDLITVLISGLVSHPLESESCTTGPKSESNDSILLIRPNQSDESLVRTSGTDLCQRLSNKENAEALHKTISALAKKYYKVPFPNACTDAAEEVEAMYSPLRKCNVDADCAYSDSVYQPITNGEMEFVITDSCSIIKPLIVANKISMQENQAKLVAARDRARDICGDKITRPDCTSILGFQATSGMPVCSSGVCRVNPSIGLALE